MLSKKEQAEVIAECFDKDKVVLTCGIHKWSYGSKRPPTFNCPQCQMASFLGLMANTPPEKRMETMEMLEETVRHLVEADNRGEIDRIKLYKHPLITITREDGSVHEYNTDRTNTT